VPAEAPRGATSLCGQYQTRLHQRKQNHLLPIRRALLSTLQARTADPLAVAVLASSYPRYASLVSEKPLDLVTRLWFAWICFFRVLFDGGFARRAWSAATDSEASAPRELPPPAAVVLPESPAPAALRSDGALLLLGLLQREGRLIDFLEQDIASFDDADVGAAVRVIHDGCQKTLRARFALEPIRTEAEGKSLVLGADFDVHAIKLTGNVTSDTKNLKGTLRHKGWRARKAELPEPTKGHDGSIVCQAEVEL